MKVFDIITDTKFLHKKCEEVTLPLSKEDKNTLLEMVEYLKQNLTSINNYPVKIKEVEFDELKSIKLKEAIEKTYIISSMRIDVILSNIIGVSRNEVNSFFDEKRVLVNHQICMNRHYEYKTGDLISVRKFGRIIIDDNIKTTKKNNLVISAKIWR